MTSSGGASVGERKKAHSPIHQEDNFKSSSSSSHMLQKQKHSTGLPSVPDSGNATKRPACDENPPILRRSKRKSVSPNPRAKLATKRELPAQSKPHMARQNGGTPFKELATTPKSTNSNHSNNVDASSVITTPMSWNYEVKIPSTVQTVCTLVALKKDDTKLDNKLECSDVTSFRLEEDDIESESKSIFRPKREFSDNCLNKSATLLPSFGFSEELKQPCTMPRYTCSNPQESGSTVTEAYII